MNFLQNLAKGVYSTVNKVGSAISSTYNTAVDLFKQNSASNLANISSLSPLQSKVQAAAIDSGSYNPGKTGPGITYTPTPQKITFPSPSGSMISQQGQNISNSLSNLAAQQNAQPAYTAYSSPFDYTPVRPSSTYGNVDSSGRVSNAQQGNQYYETNGDGSLRLVTPQNAFSGFSGGADSGSAGGFSLLSASAPSTGASGTAGIGSGSFVGNNNLGTSNVITAGQTEEDKLKQQKKDKVISPLLTAANGAPSAQMNVLNSPTQGVTGVTGSAYNPSIAIPQSTNTLNVKAPSTSINVGNIDALKSSLAKLINSPEALNSNDLAALNSNIEGAYKLALENQQAKNPIPENPVADTPEQSAFIQQSGDAFGTRQLLDEYKAQNTNLMQLQANRISLLQKVNALNEAYTPIIDDIKNNPNLPKALAARRLEQVQTKQKQVLDGFVNQLKIAEQQISDQNETVNRAFNIAKFATEEQDKAMSNNRAELKLYVDSGAIGAMSDAELKKAASSTGYDFNSLKALREAAKAPNQKSEVIGSAQTGYYSVITNTKTGEVVKKTQIAGPAVQGGDGLTTQQTQNFINISNKYQGDSIIQAADKAISANKIADQIIANPSSAGNQLTLLYTLVKNLDPNSAVREGELSLAQSTQSYLEKFKNEFSKITNNQIISPESAVQLATATKNLATIWQESGTRRNQLYSSQASTAGIGGAWQNYINGAQPTTQQASTQQPPMSVDQAYALYLQTVNGK